MPADDNGGDADRGDAAVTDVYDLRVVVERIDGESKCGLRVGDYFELVESCRLTIPPGGHFCPYALAAVLPLLPAKQRSHPPGDWIEQDCHVACPDPDERLIMRIDRGQLRHIPTSDLT